MAEKRGGRKGSQRNAKETPESTCSIITSITPSLNSDRVQKKKGEEKKKGEPSQSRKTKSGRFSKST